MTREVDIGVRASHTGEIDSAYERGMNVPRAVSARIRRIRMFAAQRRLGCRNGHSPALSHYAMALKHNGNKKSGTVQAFNVSPKGAYEGLLLETEGGIVQINFPQEWSAAVAEIAKPGQQIQADVEAEEAHGHPAHQVYRLISLNGNGSPLNGNSDGTFSGKVARLNYALHGEVNGGILDSGHFLHLKPHGAAALNLSVGMTVKGHGKTKPMVGGLLVLEADEVNGIPLEKKPKPKKKAPHHA